MPAVDVRFYRKLTSKQPAWVNIKYSFISQISTSLE